MDRPIQYPGAIPLETDLLWTNRNVMLGLGFLFQDLIGTQTLAAALPCTQTATPSMGVLLGAGRIYSLQEVDATNYSSVLADTTHQVVKQGILKDPITLALAAPTTAGQSINYLIEASYADVDTNLVTLPYYNASNPGQAYSGPNGLGAAQATVRASQILLQAKAGTGAATGSQVTPTADSGYIGLYVVTVGYGATTVVNANITKIAASFLQQGPYQPLGSFVTPAELAATNATLASDIAAVDASLALLAPIHNPALTGNPTAPTPALTDNDTTIATTAFVQNVANGTQNLRPNGWKMDPDGFMEIWGEMTIAASGGTAIDFATECGAAFASACCGVQLTTCTASDSGSIGGIALGVPFVYAVSKAGFSADNTAGATINTYWHAVGF
jgi:hypothetical protein